MSAPEGNCWLCGKYGKLSKEHIPPESAFNDCQMLLMKIKERSSTLEWEPRASYQHGICFRSLCEKCNNRYGSKYGGAYVDLVKRVGKQIGDVPYFHKISVLGVSRPLAILKQVMLQFVTANGPLSVRTNPWVAPFVREPRNQEIPRDISIYLFASNIRGGRNSGVSGHVESETGRTNVVAEFAFWPLGTVISFAGDLCDARLTPIHHWAQHPFDYRGRIDVHLCVNPIASAYPIDFRTEAEVRSQAVTAAEAKAPSREASTEMMKKAMKVSGETDSWVYSGHPDTVKKMQDSEPSR
jgi:hypothetical protein